MIWKIPCKVLHQFLNILKLYGASPHSLAGIGGSPMQMLDSLIWKSSTYHSSQSLPSSSEAIAPNAAKLANAITADASGIKCVLGGPLILAYMKAFYHRHQLLYMHALDTRTFLSSRTRPPWWIYQQSWIHIKSHLTGISTDYLCTFSDTVQVAL